MKILLISLTLFSSFSLTGQVEETLQEPVGKDSIAQNNLKSDNHLNQLEMITWEVEAQFPGGVQAMKRFIQENMRYPESHGFHVQGRVYVSFVVETDGSISNIEIPRSLTPSLDQEAIRLVASMPKWIPGTVQGIPVRSRCRLPITFTLTD